MYQLHTKTYVLTLLSPLDNNKLDADVLHKRLKNTSIIHYVCDASRQALIRQAKTKS